MGQYEVEWWMWQQNSFLLEQCLVQVVCISLDGRPPTSIKMAFIKLLFREDAIKHGRERLSNFSIIIYNQDIFIYLE